MIGNVLQTYRVLITCLWLFLPAMFLHGYLANWVRFKWTDPALVFFIIPVIIYFYKNTDLIEFEQSDRKVSTRLGYGFMGFIINFAVWINIWMFIDFFSPKSSHDAMYISNDTLIYWMVICYTFIVIFSLSRKRVFLGRWWR